MSQLQARLVELDSTIGATATKTACKWGRHVEADEVKQMMLLAIIEADAEDPTFLDQTDSYIICRAAWAANDELRRQHQHVPVTESEIEPQVDDDDATYGLDLFAEASGDWDQVDTRLDLEAAIDTDQNRVIARLTMEGYSTREIGEQVGISYRTVYNRYDRMAAAMAA